MLLRAKTAVSGEIRLVCTTDFTLNECCCVQEGGWYGGRLQNVAVGRIALLRPLVTIMLLLASGVLSRCSCIVGVSCLLWHA